MVSPDILPFLRPYLRLGEKLGSFLGQISNYAIEEVLIEYQGEVVEYGTKPITTSVLKGLLTPFVGETVNFVNAPVMAKERGIKITESTSAAGGGFCEPDCHYRPGRRWSRIILQGPSLEGKNCGSSS